MTGRSGRGRPAAKKHDAQQAVQDEVKQDPKPSTSGHHMDLLVENLYTARDDSEAGAEDAIKGNGIDDQPGAPEAAGERPLRSERKRKATWKAAEAADMGTKARRGQNKAARAAEQMPSAGAQTSAQCPLQTDVKPGSAIQVPLEEAVPCLDNAAQRARCVPQHASPSDDSHRTQVGQSQAISFRSDARSRKRAPVRSCT